MRAKLSTVVIILASAVSTFGFAQSMNWYKRIKESTPVETLVIHANTIRSLAFSSDQTKLLTCSNDMTIKIYDVKARVVDKTLKINDIPLSKRLAQVWGGKGVSGYYKAIFGPGGATVISGSPDTDVIIWDLPSQAERQRPN